MQKQKWHSTEKSVIETTDAILIAIDQKMLTSAMFLYMNKAFDGRVNHETLMLKMQAVGAPNSVIQWFCSYLNERTTSGSNPFNIVRALTH